MSRGLSTSLVDQQIPVGRETARLFPWWNMGQHTIPAGSVGGYQFNMTEYGFQQAMLNPVFRNDGRWPVAINEIRIWSDTATSGIMANLLWRFSTPLQGDFFSSWVPSAVLNNRENVVTKGDAHGVVVTLPARYYIQLGHQFRMEVNNYILTNQDWPRDLEVFLHGRDPNTGGASSIGPLNSVQLPQGIIVLPPIPISFSDGQRGQAAKSLWLEQLRFGVTRLPAAAAYPSVLRGFQVDFQPPTGPKWTKDRYTPLMALMEQPTWNRTDGAIVQMVIHRPRSPYILRPGDQLKLEGLYYNDAGTGQSDLQILACARGVQAPEGVFQ